MGKKAQRRREARDARRPRGASGETKEGTRKRRRFYDHILNKIMHRKRAPGLAKEKVTTIAREPKPVSVEQDVITAEQLGYGQPRPSGLVTPSPDANDKA